MRGRQNEIAERRGHSYQSLNLFQHKESVEQLSAQMKTPIVQQHSQCIAMEGEGNEQSKKHNADHGPALPTREPYTLLKIPYFVLQGWVAGKYGNEGKCCLSVPDTNHKFYRRSSLKVRGSEEKSHFPLLKVKLNVEQPRL